MTNILFKYFLVFLICYWLYKTPFFWCKNIIISFSPIFFPLHLITALRSNQNLLGIINVHEDVSKVTRRNYTVSSPLWCLHSAATTRTIQGIRQRQEQQPQPKPCTHSHLWVIINFTSSTWLARPPPFPTKGFRDNPASAKSLGTKPWHPGRSAYTWHELLLLRCTGDAAQHCWAQEEICTFSPVKHSSATLEILSGCVWATRESV